MEQSTSVEDVTEQLGEEVFYQALRRIIQAQKGDGTFVISIIGGAGSGKTTLAKKLAEILGSADTLATDGYLVGDRKYRRANLEGGDPTKKYNPAKLIEHIQAIKGLRDSETIGVPTYNEQTGEAVDAKEYSHQVGKVDYLIIEGDFDFVESPDLLIFFDVSADVRLQNRIRRDLVTRGASHDEEIRENFKLREDLQYIPYTLPAKDKADIVVKVTISNNGEYVYQIIDKRGL